MRTDDFRSRAALGQKEEMSISSIQLWLTANYTTTNVGTWEGVLRVFADNNSDHERNITIAKGIHNELSSSTELHKETMHYKCQTTLDKFISEVDADDDL